MNWKKMRVNRLNNVRKYIGIVVPYIVLFSSFALAGGSNELNDYIADLAFNMPQIQIPQFPEQTVNITEFGAVGDGQTENTEAFVRAITTCADSGGGRVFVAAGLWLTGPIRLKSHINLHLEPGAIILFSPQFEDYPLIQSHYEGHDRVRCLSPISGVDLENIAITGQGIIDGSGEAWRPVKRFKMTNRQWQELVASGGVVNRNGTVWWPSEQAMHGAELMRELGKRENVDLQDYAEAREFLRPVMIGLVNCKNVLLDGPTFQNSPAWNIHLLMCENAVIRNINVRNPWYSQNGDGLDLESCRNILVYNCCFDVGDDAICLKSGRNEYGRRRGKPSENIAIADCIVYHGHGGFTIGSEMSGGVRNIDVRRCTFLGTDVGLRFKSTRGRGGLVENIYIRDIYMKSITTEAIRFNMFYENQAPLPDENGEIQQSIINRPEVKISEETPCFRRIFIKNIICRGAGQAAILQGLPELALSQVELDSINISADKGLMCVDVEGVSLRNISISPEKGPAMAFYNSRQVFIRNADIVGGSEPFLTINGAKSRQIELQGV